MKRWLPIFAAACLWGSGPARAETWGIVVGVDDYVRDSIQDLRYASADAKLFAQAMTDLLHVPRDHLFVFTTDAVDSSSTPTRLNLVYRLDWLRKNARPDDKVVFFFAGHGANLDNESFLLTEESDNRTRETLKASALATRDLAGLLQRQPASQTLSIIDACRNDPGGKKTLSPDEKMPELVIGGANQECAGLLSCSVGQRSWEWDEKKHGFFSYHLVEGLQGGAVEPDGRVTLQSLSNYLTETVPASTQRAVKETQTPFVYYVGPSMKNWVLAVTPKAARQKAAVVVPKLEAGSAKYDLLAAQKAEVEARLRVEEARRHELESRLAEVEKNLAGSTSEEIQKLTLSKELALKELLETRRQLDAARAQLAARGGSSAETDLILAEREQLKAENRVLQARITLLQEQLQKVGISMARGLTLEQDARAQAVALARESQDGPNSLSAAAARIEVLLSDSRQLRTYLEQLLQTTENDLTRMGLIAKDALKLQQEEAEVHQMQARIWDTRLQQARQSAALAGLQLQQNDAAELEFLRKELRLARAKNQKLMEELEVLLKYPSFKRRWASYKYWQLNSPPGWGDLTDTPVRTGPELDKLP